MKRYSDSTCIFQEMLVKKVRMGYDFWDSKELEERLWSPRCELEPEPSLDILGRIQELLNIVEELLQLLQNLQDPEILKQLIKIVKKLHKLIGMFLTDLEKPQAPKIDNGIPSEEAKRIHWKELVDELSNQDILIVNGSSRKRFTKKMLMVPVNGSRLIVTIEELGPGLPDSD